MADKVTIQDIADALGVSRNTVSKAINNTGVLAEATRMKVLAKAAEMGYKQFSYVDLESMTQVQKKEPSGEVALITTWFLNSSHFSSMMLDKLQYELSKAGYSLSMHVVRPEEIENGQLPASIRLEHCAAILCIEVFDYDYAKMLSELDVPVLFVDGPVAIGRYALPVDKLIMNNVDAIFQFVRDMRDEGVTTMGFVGEYMHCESFYERFMAMKDALYLNKMEFHDEYNILDVSPLSEGKRVDTYNYRTYLRERLEAMPQLPEVFVCANDFVAIDLLDVLGKMGKRVPEDVKILGFDDSQESRIMTPRLSTVHIHSQILGFSAAELLLSRIADPQLNYRSVYCQTDLILRESTASTPNKA